MGCASHLLAGIKGNKFSLYILQGKQLVKVLNLLCNVIELEKSEINMSKYANNNSVNCKME